ncbi:MAG: hypothetical protein WCD81_04650 [Candidatus Bathyarchaeia archaeon]
MEHSTSFGHMQRRLCFAADKYNVDMRKVRFELILELKALAEQAQQKAIDTHPAKVETKQNWSRLAAYISQVINGIGKTYEEAKIDADLQELENLIKEIKTKQQTPTQQQQKAETP